MCKNSLRNWCKNVCYLLLELSKRYSNLDDCAASISRCITSTLDCYQYTWQKNSLGKTHNIVESSLGKTHNIVESSLGKTRKRRIKWNLIEKSLMNLYHGKIP